MKKLSIFILSSMLLSICIKSNAQSIDSTILPQYVKGNAGAGSNTARLHTFFWAKLSGLTANSYYRYGVRAIKEGQDDSTNKGAGNQIFIHGSSAFTYSSSYSIKNAGQYDSIMSDNNGEYQGWFGIELTGNSRFTKDNYIKFRIILNDGAGGNSEMYYLTTSDSVKCLDLSTTSGTGCTGIYSYSKATDKNFVLLYDDVNGSNRPLSIGIIEQDGLDYRTLANTMTFYKNNVDSVSGAWGAIIPNDLANGVRRIENRKISDASLVHANTDADGVWTTGSISTVNPTGGATAIQISGTDAPLIQVSTPTVSFSGTVGTYDENAGTVSIDINIATPSNTTASSVDITVNGGTATSGSDYTYTTQTVTFPAGSSATQTVTLNIIDDVTIESAEDIKLTFSNPSTGVSIGNNKDYTINIKDNDNQSAVLNVYNIGDVTTEDASGVCDSVGVHCELHGVVYSPNYGTPGLAFFLRDQTGGILVYELGNAFSYSPSVGDSIKIVGTVGQLDGMAVFSLIDSVVKIGTGNLKTPIAVSSKPSSVHVCDFISMNQLILIDPTSWPVNATGVCFATNGTDTIPVYVQKEANIGAAPKGFFNIKGMGAQKAVNGNLATGFAIFPRMASDITPLTTIMFEKNTSIITEGQTSTINVSLVNADNNNATTVEVILNGGTAVSGTNFTFTSPQTLTFPAGSTNYQVISIPTISDNLIKADQTVILKLQNISSNALLTNPNHTLTISENGNNAISDIQTSNVFQIMPNPAKDYVNISSSLNINQVSLYNINGALVYETNKNLGSQNNIQLNGFSKGIYIIKVTIDNQVSFKKLIVE